jgi:hypothetical protein
MNVREGKGLKNVNGSGMNEKDQEDMGRVIYS